MPGRLLHYQHPAHNDAALCAALAHLCGADSACVFWCAGRVCLRSQAEGSWSKERCCAVQANYCDSHDWCYGETASSDYLYRLSPGEPERYEPIPGGDTRYQYAHPIGWPTFGSGYDLRIGYNGPPGTNGYCDQGGTYRGSPNAACGGGWDGNGKPCEGLGCWGHTDLEVWFI